MSTQWNVSFKPALLRINYRSTAEIGEAAQAYLIDGALAPEEMEGSNGWE